MKIKTPFSIYSKNSLVSVEKHVKWLLPGWTESFATILTEKNLFSIKI